MQRKPKYDLDKVTIIGRTYREYMQLFQMTEEDLKGKTNILDVGSGVSAFCGTANDLGIKVTGFDPIYQYTADELEEQCKSSIEIIKEKLKKTEEMFNYAYYRDIEGLIAHRKEAYISFLSQYRKDRSKYVRGELPNTPFVENQFDLILNSHFLFLYDHLMDYEFHKKCVIEFMRIGSNEAFIYPLANLDGLKSPFVEKLMNDPELQDFNFQIVESSFEFLKNANQILRISK